MLPLGNSLNCLGQESNAAQQVMSPDSVTVVPHASAPGHYLPIVFEYISFPGFSFCYNYAFYYCQYLSISFLLTYVLSGYCDPYGLTFDFASFFCSGLYLSQYATTIAKPYVNLIMPSIHRSFFSSLPIFHLSLYI